MTVHANPGRFVPGQGLVLSLPEDERVAQADIGIDKAEVIRVHADGATCIAFSGNSHVDLTGAQQLRLITTDGGDGIACDHAEWADARLK